MPKNIVLLSDGTGNSAAKVWRTNVWRTYQALDLRDGSKQIARYDDGVGTSTFRPWALLTGAFGFGLKRNVLSLYKFLSTNYEPGDRIYCFGFSRGAYTIRLLAGLITVQGLINKNASNFGLRAEDMYRAYRAERFKGYEGDAFTAGLIRFWRGMRNVLVSLKRWVLRQPSPDCRKGQRPDIKFLGVWDTVAAYGLPVHEMTRGIDLWVWPISPTDRVRNPRIKRVAHALSIDDERTTFHPLMWDESTEATGNSQSIAKEKLSQVWFAGVHANVGGGYPDDALSNVPLDWMMDIAAKEGLQFVEALRARIKVAATAPILPERKASRWANGKLYDSRAGAAAYYRYGPRHIWNLSNYIEKIDTRDNVANPRPKIHHSVFDRIRLGDRYAPFNIPERYAVVSESGKILSYSPKYETKVQAGKRQAQQERIWDLVWWRRILFFSSLFLAIYIVTRPLWPANDPFYSLLREATLAVSPLIALLDPLVSFALNVLRLLLPESVFNYVNLLASDRSPFMLQLFLFALLYSISTGVQGKIRNEMHGLWEHVRSGKQSSAPPPNGPISRLRRSASYQNLHWAMKRWLLPAAFGLPCLVLSLFYLPPLAYSRFVTAIETTGGWICTASPQTTEVKGKSDAITLLTSDVCKASGISVTAGERYCVRMEMTQEWKDGSIPSGLEGIPFAQSVLAQKIAIPFRRSVFEPYFRPFARIGANGADDYALSPKCTGCEDTYLKRIDTEFIARKSGELFFFVNDVLLPFPLPREYFYARNNQGAASIRIEKLERGAPCRSESASR